MYYATILLFGTSKNLNFLQNSKIFGNLKFSLWFLTAFFGIKHYKISKLLPKTKKKYYVYILNRKETFTVFYNFTSL